MAWWLWVVVAGISALFAVALLLIWVLARRGGRVDGDDRRGRGGLPVPGRRPTSGAARDGEVEEENDDIAGSGNGNSWVVAELEADSYTVEGATGSFTLRLAAE